MLDAGRPDPLPTITGALSACARGHAGSWSARADAESLAAWALAVHDDAFGATSLLVDVSPADVPQVVEPHADGAMLLGHREALVLACIDGVSSLEHLVDLIGLPTGDLLATLGQLCARGVIALDRSRRKLRAELAFVYGP